MAATRTVLKQYFKKYATPTEEQFAALIDAFVHKDEDSLTQSKIDGLSAALESKVSSSDLASAVATAVVETLQGGNIEVTPAAHQHAIADVEDLGTRLTTLETSKADYEAFKALVTAFLNDADVQDTTINRWKELEDFLNGITDSDTLAGMLAALKAAILAEVPQPQTTVAISNVEGLQEALNNKADVQESETSGLITIPLKAAEELPRWDVTSQHGTYPKRETIMYIGRTNQNFQHGLFYEPVDNNNNTPVYAEYEFAVLDIIPIRYDNAPASYDFPLPLSKFPFGFTGFVDGKYGYPSGSGSYAYEVYLSGGTEYQDGDYSFWTDLCQSYPERYQISSPRDIKFAIFTNSFGDRLILPDRDNVIHRWYDGVCNEEGYVAKEKCERIDILYNALYIPNEGDALAMRDIDQADFCTCPDTYNYSISEKEAIWQPIITSPVVS